MLGRVCRESHAADLVVVCPTMSKRHCVVGWCWTASCFVLLDCGSLNGTYAAEMPLSDPEDSAQEGQGEEEGERRHREWTYALIGDALTPPESRVAARLEPGAFFKAAACTFYVRQVIPCSPQLDNDDGGGDDDDVLWGPDPGAESGVRVGLFDPMQQLPMFVEPDESLPLLELRIVAGPDKGVRMAVNELGCIVGRHRLLASLVIHDAANNVSRAHAKIEYERSSCSFVLGDISSTGTWICKAADFNPVTSFVSALWGGTDMYTPSAIVWTRVLPGSQVALESGDLLRCGKASVLAVT